MHVKNSIQRFPYRIRRKCKYLLPCTIHRDYYINLFYQSYIYIHIYKSKKNASRVIENVDNTYKQTMINSEQPQVERCDNPRLRNPRRTTRGGRGVVCHPWSQLPSRFAHRRRLSVADELRITGLSRFSRRHGEACARVNPVAHVRTKTGHVLLKRTLHGQFHVLFSRQQAAKVIDSHRELRPPVHSPTFGAHLRGKPTTRFTYFRTRCRFFSLVGVDAEYEVTPSSVRLICQVRKEVCINR